MSDNNKQQRYLEISRQITEQVGGKENIVASTHCATRLRIVLKDYDKINKEAIDVLRKGTEQYDGESQQELASDLYALLGDLLHTTGKKAEAYAAYDSSLVINPENMGSLNNYAYFLSLDKEQLDKAEAMSYKTVQADEINPTYLDTYAWILYVKGRYEQARLYIDETLKYIDDTEDNAGIIDHAGDIYWQCGEREKAVDFWKRALKLTTDVTEQKEIEAKLKKHTTE